MEIEKMKNFKKVDIYKYVKDLLEKGEVIPIYAKRKNDKNNESIQIFIKIPENIEVLCLPLKVKIEEGIYLNITDEKNFYPFYGENFEDIYEKVDKNDENCLKFK